MFNAKLVFLFTFALSIAAVMANDGLVGGVSKLEGDDLKEAVETLNTSLTKLAAGDGPNYTVSKVISATRQVVSGSLYKYEVEFIDSNKAVKKCHCSIWSQPWIKDDGIEVTFDCEGEEKVVKKHSP